MPLFTSHFLLKHFQMQFNQVILIFCLAEDPDGIGKGIGLPLKLLVNLLTVRLHCTALLNLAAAAVVVDC